MELRDFFREHPRAAIAFSGGVDSTYLLAEALRQRKPEIAPDFAKFTRIETYDAGMQVYR